MKKLVALRCAALIGLAGGVFFTGCAPTRSAQPATPSIAESLASTASKAQLENTYWKLTQIGSTPVAVTPGEREPHLVLHSQGRRAAVHGGCNQGTGSYVLDGDRIRFTQMTSTMSAYADGMDQEGAFNRALVRAARYAIRGETLELFDEDGESLARFDSVYLR
jgi:heat shock protein HslJ